MKVKYVSVPAVTKVVEVEPAREEVVLTLTKYEAQLLRVFIRGVSGADRDERLVEAMSKYPSLRDLDPMRAIEDMDLLAMAFMDVGTPD